MPCMSFDSETISSLSGGTGPPHFRSPNIHLFLEPEPSRCWSVSKWGLCHSDLFSSLPLWPPDLCAWHKLAVATPPLPVMLSQAQAAECPAAKQLRIWIYLGWCLHSLVTWGLHCTAETKYSVQGQSTMSFNYLFDSSIQAGLLGHGSSVSVDLSGGKTSPDCAVCHYIIMSISSIISLQMHPLCN